MKPTLVIAPPPPVRRRHRLHAEPVVFAVLLTLLTLGINVAGPMLEAADSHATAQPAQVAQVASAR